MRSLGAGNGAQRFVQVFVRHELGGRSFAKANDGEPSLNGIITLRLGHFAMSSGIRETVQFVRCHDVQTFKSFS